MKTILEEGTIYPYLKENAVHRLENARFIAHRTGMLKSNIVKLGDYSFCMFPWLGTRSRRTMAKILMSLNEKFAISKVEMCDYYILFRMEKGDAATLEKAIEEVVRSGITKDQLVAEMESPAFEKYDTYLPPKLLRKAYIADKLDLKEIQDRYKIKGNLQ